MNCSACRHENPDASAFCEECGTRLERLCPACGNACAPTAKFCRSCGTALVTPPARSGDDVGARKVVTIVFADLIGSTSLHERLDAESSRNLMDRYYRALHTAVEAHSGTVVKLLGDGVMAAFGIPRVAEDDAIRAVRAAMAMVHAVRLLGEEHRTTTNLTTSHLSIRVAVNTGEVVVSADQHDVVGDPVNVAARLQQEARDGDVLIGEATRRLISERVTLAPLGALTLKGRSETVVAYRVVSLDHPAVAPTTPFVGRDEELRRMMTVYETAVTARSARLAIVLGSPGLGKSRLLNEFTRRLGERATVLSAHCEAAAGATFAPLAEALRLFLHIDDGAGGEALRQPAGETGAGRAREAVRAAITAAIAGDEPERSRIVDGVSALLAGTPAPPEETFFVVRRLLAALAGVQPVVLAIDDLQWAEPLLLDLTEHLVQWSTDVPLLVLVAARPELRDVRSSLVTPGGLVADVVTLAGLDAGAATRLAASVIGADELPAAIAGRVLATSEGNPLFVGELVRMLVHDGALKREGERWTTGVELAELKMPPTIHALLAARIERLRAEERTVLERAAVVGRHFSRAAVTHLLPREITDLDVRLEALRRSDLIEPDAGWFLGEPALRFHHILIRDAAYRRLLKGTRAELHGRFADWLETRVGEAVEYDETIGWHLEQAHQHLRELGPMDACGRALGNRAARYLAAAGRRALARDDLAPAASLLGRALDRLDSDDPARANLALDWCEAVLTAGDVTHARDAIDELAKFVGEQAPSSAPESRAPFDTPSEGGGYSGRAVGEVAPEAFRSSTRVGPVMSWADSMGRLRAWHTCFAGQLAVLTDPQALRRTADAVVAAAEQFRALGDAAGEAKAHAVHALALSRLGKVGACEVALDRALAAARRAHDRRRANAVLTGAPLAALWGPSPVTRASGRCLDVVRVLRITQGAPAVEAVALRCQAVLEALRGRTAAARRMIASSRRMVEELGITQRLLEADVFAGLIELLDGDAAAAARCLRGAYEGLRNHGLGIDAAQAAALLGRALLAQGRAEEAEALSHQSEALAGDDIKAAIAWRGVRAEALAQRGEHTAAVALARAAVDIAATTDALLDHADARLALAAVLRLAGQGREADAENARATELWEAKGATLLADRARGDSGAVAAVPSGPDDRGTLARHVQRRVRANAATACLSRLEVAIRARDLETVTTLIADDTDVVHHPTGATIHREEGLNRFRLLFRTEGLAVSYDIIATLGEALALGRDVTSFAGFVDNQLDFGASRSSYVNLFEVDGHGLVARVEVFAENRLGDAVARMYERYAELLRDGPERARAAATPRAVAAVLGPFDLERYAVGIAPDVEFIDHRTVGFPSGFGVAELLRSIGTLLDTADDVTTRVDDILALESDAFLVRWTTSGKDRVSHGPFEWQFLRLCVFGADGFLTRAEQFDVDRAEQALARFDALRAAPPTAPSAIAASHQGQHPESIDAALPSDQLSKRPPANAFIENAATRTAALIDGAWGAHDWERFAAVFHTGFRNSDRRWMVQLDLDRKQYLDSIRRIFKITSNTTAVLATRGERLAMLRVRWKGSDEQFGPSEGEFISVTEVDARGQCAALVHFDPDDLDAAYAELEQRYAAEAADARRAALTRAFTRSFAARDWDALSTLLAPDLVVNDHRLLGWEPLHGRAAYIQALKQLVDLAPDVQLRVDHLTMSAPRFLYVTTWLGTRDGGAFEAPSVIVCELDDMGRIRRFDQYELDQLKEVKARFAGSSENVDIQPQPEADGSSDERDGCEQEQTQGLGQAVRRWPDPLRIPPNAASRLRDRINDAFMAGDWATQRSLASDGLVFEDRRRWSVMSGSVEMWIKSAEFVRSAPGVRFVDAPIGMLGDRIELRSRVVTGVGPDGGTFESEFIVLTEIGADGRLAASINFEPEARREAFDEAESRFIAGEAAAIGGQAPIVGGARSLAQRDWQGLREHLAHDAVICDHRTLGMGSLGRDEWIDSLRVWAELAPDLDVEQSRILTWNRHGRVALTRVFGTMRGGETFETVVIGVALTDGDRVERYEVFDVGDADHALARFAECCAERG